MGRTNPTFRDTLRSLEDQWSPYRRALRHQDQQHFDALWGHARQYSDAGGYLNHADPETVMLFSICLAQEQQLQALRDTLHTITGDVSADRDEHDRMEEEGVDAVQN